MVFLPSFNLKRSFLYDLKEIDPSKNYRHPIRTTKTIQKVFDDMFRKCPEIQAVDKVIMESQHKTNMQILSWLLVSNLLPRLSGANVEYISPLACKRNFKIPLTGTHHGNKVAATVFVENSKNRLVASETVTEHNTADACLLLNTYLQTTKNIIYKSIDDWSTMALEVGTKFVCPKCGNNTGVLRFCEKQGSKLYGKHFLTCWWVHDKDKPGEKKCTGFTGLFSNKPVPKNGMVGDWKVLTGDEDAEVEEQTTTKSKKRPAKVEPKGQPAKKAAKVEAPLPPSIGEKPATQQQIITALKKLSDAIKSSNSDMEARIMSRFDEIQTELSELKESFDNLLASVSAEAPAENQLSEELPAGQQENTQESQKKIVTQEELDEIVF
jgi:hypothetical protein